MALATNIALAVAANLRKTSINTVEKAAELRKTYSDEWVLGKGPTVDIWTIYTADKPIGVPGAYGSARTAIHKQTRVKRVVKTISKRGRDAETIARFRGEIETMRKLDHPNVVKFYEAYESKDDLFIVMEHCGGGDLFEEIEKFQKTLAVPVYTEQHASKVMKQILEGLKHLHDNAVVHCDLKPDNIVYSSADEKERHLKIIDFGMARFWNARQRQHFHATAGTPYYAAPEVVEREYNRACDMWSIGAMLYVMLIGYPPFWADENMYRSQYADSKQATIAFNNAIKHKVLKGFEPVVKRGVGAWFPQERPISKSAMDLIGKLMVYDISKRLTVKEALAHPWISGDEASSVPLHPEVLRSLGQFDARYKFQQAALEMMTELLNADEHANLAKTFAAMDLDGDGLITVSEFKQALGKPDWHKYEFSREELERMFNCADVNGDGFICYKELLMASVEMKLVGREERVRQAFAKFDTNADGKISAEEVSKVLNVSVQDAAKLIDEADKDRDGVVNYEDFLEMWRDNQQRQPTAF